MSLVGAGLAAAGPVGAADTYEGDGIVALANRTPEQARREALDKARQDALAQSRIEIVGVTTLHLAETTDTGAVYEGFAQFTQQITRGLILSEEVLIDSLETVQGGPEAYHQWHVRLRAKVEPQGGEADPTFKLDVDINRTTFRDGEAVELEFESTKDCFLTVLNLYSNDQLLVVLPNPQSPDNFLPARKRLTYPPPESPIDLEVGLMPDKKSDQEALLVIATRRDIPFTLESAPGAGGLVAMSDALMTINNWLVDIPADERTQTMISYGVVR